MQTTETKGKHTEGLLLEALKECRVHAKVALAQSAPTDDAIIMGHVADIAKLADAAIVKAEGR